MAPWDVVISVVAATMVGMKKGPGLLGVVQILLGMVRTSKGAAKSRVSMLEKIRYRMRKGVLGRGGDAIFGEVVWCGCQVELRVSMVCWHEALI